MKGDESFRTSGAFSQLVQAMEAVGVHLSGNTGSHNSLGRLGDARFSP